MKRGTAWCGIGAAAVTAAAVLGPGGPPIYDGIGSPDEPYRYVSAPAEAGTVPTRTPAPARSAPTTGTATVASVNGASGAALVSTGEQGPQASFYLPAGALSLPAGATATVTLTPLAPTPPLPADGTVVSNVYRLAATAGGTPVALSPAASQAATSQGPGVANSRSPRLQLRAPDSQQPGPVFEHFDGASWRQVATDRVGQDIYLALAPALGDWALVRPEAAASSPTASGGGAGLPLAIGGGVLVLLAGTIVVVRLLRRGTAPDGSAAVPGGDAAPGDDGADRNA